MQEKIKELSRNILFELVIVVLGILLALAINSWYQDLEMRQQAETLLQKLEYEVSNNQTNISQIQKVYEKNIELTNRYIKEVEDGVEIDVDYSVNLLEADIAVWKFIQNRKELDQLPVDLLIAISESYRSLEETDSLIKELAFIKIGRLVSDQKVDKKKALQKLLRELVLVKFHLDIAQLELKQSKELIDKYQEH